MIENAEVNYGTALNIINDSGSKDKELRMARATIVALAGQGHRGALDLIVKSPNDYDADVDDLIEKIPDNEEKASFYRKLLKASTDRTVHSKYALKLLGCGDLGWLPFCDNEDAVPLLQELDPKAYPLKCYGGVLHKYADSGRRRNKWAANLIAILEETDDTAILDEADLSRISAALDGPDRDKFDTAVDRLWMNRRLEKVSDDALHGFYWFLKRRGDGDQLQRVGIHLLRKGIDTYLSSEEFRRRLAGIGDRIKDPELLERVIEASSEEAVYAALSENYRLSMDLRMEFARKAMESGSDKSRLAYANLIWRSKDADYLEVVRQCLMVKEQSYRLRNLLCFSYEKLAGGRRDDSVALELYRAYENDREISESVLAELRSRFLEQPLKE